MKYSICCVVIYFILFICQLYKILYDHLGFELLLKFVLVCFCRPDLLVRSARHYEGAFQVQVRKAVSTARKVKHLFQNEVYTDRDVFIMHRVVIFLVAVIG